MNRKIYRAQVESEEGYYDVTTYAALGIPIETKSFTLVVDIMTFLYECLDKNPRFTSNWML